MGCRICLEILILNNHQLGNLDDWIQSDFSVIPKVTIANLCKAMLDDVGISVSSKTLNVKNVER